MKSLIFILFCSTCVLLSVKADTIDFWHVYLNQKKIKNFNQNTKDKTIFLQINNCKNSDTLTITYFRDTPCYDCKTFLDIEDNKHLILLQKTGIGTINPFSISLKKLLNYFRENKMGSLEFYYYENLLITSKSKLLLFKIKLE
jgi:hypothetical protein